MIHIDGSYNEGGGQILRTALTLSLATLAPFHDSCAVTAYPHEHRHDWPVLIDEDSATFGKQPELYGRNHSIEACARALQANSAKSERLVDGSVLWELEKEGFFNETAKR